MQHILYYIWLAESFPYGSIKPMQIANKFSGELNRFYENLDKEAKEFNITEKTFKKLKTTRISDYSKIVEDCNKLNIKITCFDSEHYPKKLKNFDSAPIVIYHVGDLDVLNGPSVAVVGTRKASNYGLKVAKKLAKELAEYGITVVSGCAEGIDVNAHYGALESKGKTVSVLGTSLEKNYPEGSGSLKREIFKNGGVVLSEYAPKTRTFPWLFPIRNRIIVGLADSVIVVQSPKKSGAMITAEIACNSGKELFCVPPEDIYDERNEGIKKCLKEGANLLLDIDDILNTYRFSNYPIPKKLKIANNFTTKKIPEKLKPVFEAVGNGGNLDKIAEKLEIPAAELLPMLTELEILGLIKKFELSYVKC